MDPTYLRTEKIEGLEAVSIQSPNSLEQVLNMTEKEFDNVDLWRLKLWDNIFNEHGNRLIPIRSCESMTLVSKKTYINDPERYEAISPMYIIADFDQSFLCTEFKDEVQKKLQELFRRCFVLMPVYMSGQRTLRIYGSSIDCSDIHFRNIRAGLFILEYVIHGHHISSSADRTIRLYHRIGYVGQGRSHYNSGDCYDPYNLVKKATEIEALHDFDSVEAFAI